MTTGYVMLCKGSLSAEDAALVNAHGLWSGKSRTNGSDGRRGVKEHHLVALKKYGSLPRPFLIRHLNGDKTDNRPENLVLGTHKDNCMDHRTAVAEMMYWRERALVAEGKDPSSAIQQLSEALS